MLVSPEPAADHAAPAGHFCPACLRRVSPAQAERGRHRERCTSGDLDVALIRCPSCGLVLAAEVDLMGGAEAATAASTVS